MKTKEMKARELVIKMQFSQPPLMFDKAKQCALIAVDEIIDSLQHIPDIDVRGNILLDKIKYFRQVKEEIEKL